MVKNNYPILILLTLMLVFPFTRTNAQVTNPEKIKKSIAFSKSIRLGDVPPIAPIHRDRAWKERVIKNMFGFMDEFENAPILERDPVLQDYMAGSRSEPIVQANFPGVGNRQGVAPPDTDGDVGPNHYLQIVNSSFAVYDKQGTIVYGPADNSTLWSGFIGPWTGTNDGDPIVIYDEIDGRWLASQFALPNYPNGPFYELVAVSATDDPTGEWYRYAFEFDKMPDYPKISVWHDGYYMAINQFSPPNLAWSGGGIVAMDRDAMINGEEEATMILFNTGSSHGSLLPADIDSDQMPPADQPMVFLNLGQNSLRLWEVNIDWEDMDNSTAQYAASIPTEPFSTNGLNIQQPGTGTTLSTLAGRLMFRLQYRNFGDYQVMVTNHTVNVGSGRAGVRWYELRNNDGETWEMHQQGTYAPADGENRWMASVAMNANGDIAVGYSVSSAATYPSIRIAGQTSGAPMGLGILDIDEITIKAGNASQTGIDRWGDYSKMSIDVEDGQTFWYTTQYSNGGWNWKTQVASFGFSQEPIADFSSDETLIPTGENIDFNDLTVGIPTVWEWTFPGGDPETSTEQNPQNIQYATEGTYDVQLIATNLLGTDTLVKEDYIAVSSEVLPEVAFEVDIDFVCTGGTVIFTDLTTISPVQWQWEFSPATVTFLNGTDANSQNPEVAFDEAGSYNVTLTAWNLNGASTTEVEDMITAGGFNPYFRETFEDMGFASQYWTIENPDDDVTWGLYEIGGTTPGNMAAGINFGVYFSLGERDRLISPPMNLSDLSSAALEFQHAYAKRYFEITDSLVVYVSDDCGDSWTRVFASGEDGSGNFATHELSDDFWPEVAEDWCGSGWGASCINIDLSPWAGQADVRFAFESYSAYGNPLFIDNITVSQFVGVEESAIAEDISVYPNPASSRFSVIIPEQLNISQVQLVNHLGQIVYQQQVDPSSKTIEINPEQELPGGIYLLKSFGNGNAFINKVVIR